jgi:aspartate racemase
MNPAIGIVGGLGPYAGLDLIKKVHDNVDVRSDQDYPDVFMVSAPRLIPDRSLYIKNPETQNPSVGIAYCVKKLSLMGATDIGIPCNTAHAPIIMNQVRAFIELEELNVRIHSIVEETYSFAKEHLGSGKIGLLATEGTYHSGIYTTVFEKDDYFKIIEPDAEDKAKIWDSIYSRDYGIKAHSNPVVNQAVDNLSAVTMRMIEKENVGAIIMGCTEIPLAMGRIRVDIPLLDPADILARSLVKSVMAQRLKPMKKI